jgi:hypothetical protein
MSVYVMCSIVGFYLSCRNYDGWRYICDGGL